VSEWSADWDGDEWRVECNGSLAPLSCRMFRRPSARVYNITDGVSWIVRVLQQRGGMEAETAMLILFTFLRCTDPGLPHWLRLRQHIDFVARAAQQRQRSNTESLRWACRLCDVCALLAHGEDCNSCGDAARYATILYGGLPMSPAWLLGGRRQVPGGKWRRSDRRIQM
jgi:hypothetical protein